MKDLKENIQKNNMKKLVLSAVLGMFCYYTNNAAEKPIKIDDVLMTMLECQNNINEAKNAIKELEQRIYSTIKDKDGKVKKEKLLEFIKNQIEIIKNENTTKDTKYDILKFAMKKIEQYFHLEEKENDYECTKDNLTEIFWNNEQKEETQKIEKPIKGIQIYFLRIVNTEGEIDSAFKEYYKAKKTEKINVGAVENVEDVVIEEIMKECCGGEINEDLDKKFSAKLEQLYKNPNIGGEKESIIRTIKRRITLKNKITKKDFKSFLKQKIGIEEKKEVEQKIVNDHLKQEGCCPCCDC